MSTLATLVAAPSTQLLTYLYQQPIRRDMNQLLWFGALLAQCNSQTATASMGRVLNPSPSVQRPASSVQRPASSIQGSTIKWICGGYSPLHRNYVVESKSAPGKYTISMISAPNGLLRRPTNGPSTNEIPSPKEQTFRRSEAS